MLTMSNNLCIYFVTLLSILESSYTYNTIDFKRPCNDLSPECLKVSLQSFIPIFADGDPDLGLERLDPYYLYQLNLTLSGGINIQFTDGIARGLKTCIVDYARILGYTLETQIHCNLTIKGKYKSTGYLMRFPIDGEGLAAIKCRNIGIHSIIKFGKKQKEDGKTYFYIKNEKIRHSYDGRVSYNMTNLFKGNPEIGNALLDFMNSNWRMIADEFGDPMVQIGVDSVMRNIRRLVDVIPVDELLKL